MTSVVRAIPQVNGRGQNYPSHHTHSTPLNRQSPNIAHVITSTISARMPHLVKITPGVTSPHIAKVTTHFFLFLCTQNLSTDLQGVSEKSSPTKTFWNIFTSVKSFCVIFCKFLGSSYPHVSASFCTFILIFHQMALIFTRVPIVFTVSGFEY